MKNQAGRMADGGRARLLAEGWTADSRAASREARGLDKRRTNASGLAIRAMLLGLLVGLAAGRSLAVPACPEPIVLKQPGGKAVRIFLRGDEHLHWHEDGQGFTVLKVKADGPWVYAVRDAAGRLIGSQSVVGEVDPVKLGLPRRLLAVGAEEQASSSARSRAAAAVDGGPAMAPKIGTMKNLVLLVAFSDKAFTYTRAQYDALFNAIGYTTDGAQGSVKDYYKEVSYNQLNVDSVVADPVTLANGYAYYGANNASGDDVRPREMVQEALAALEARGFDFSALDSDNDGAVDGLTVIHAGGGEEYGGNDSNYIWSHQWQMISTVTYDGKTMRTYHTEPERRGWDSAPSSQGITRIGVICHETGHFLGLPDLYDYGYDSKGVGNFCLMAGGSWNGNYGTQPAQMSAWCKKYLTWLTPSAVTAPGTYTVPRVEDNQTAYRLSGGFPSTQYFLVENRQGYGFDASLPGSTRGLLVWHVDETMANNNDQTHYKVDLEEASGTQHLELNSNSGDDADYFRSGTLTTFNYGTTPNSRSYAALPLGQDITAVSAASASMTFTVSFQTLQFKSASYSVAENGTSVRVYVSRTGGSSGPVSVNYATANGTATAGSDYAAKSGTLSWTDADAADKYFDVTILDNSVAEGSETFTASLTGAVGAALGAPSNTTVTIADNDAVVTLQDLAQTYNGTARNATATTVPPGLTVDITYNGQPWAPTNAGNYAVTGTVNDAVYQGAATGMLSVAKAAQAISFPVIAGQTATSVVALVATASSGLPVSFAVGSGPATIVGGTNLGFTGAGAVSVVASQAGNSNWSAAPNVTNSFSVVKASQASLAFAPFSPQAYNTTNALAASGGSGTGILSYAVLSGPGQIVGGTNLWVTSGSGSVTVQASRAGDTFYNAASVTAGVACATAAQTVSFPVIAGQTATSVVALVATASSGLPVSFAVGSGPATIVGGTNLGFTGAGAVSVVASQAGNSNWGAAPGVTQVVTVSKAIAQVTLQNLNQLSDGTPRVVTATTVPAGLEVAVTYDGSASPPTNAGSYAVTGTVNEVLYQGGTNGTLTVAAGQHTLTVVSAYGGEHPGTLTTDSGTVVSESVTNSPAAYGGSTQYVCTAAAVTGCAFTQVSPTNVTLTLTNDATLTWQWSTQYWFSAASGAGGSVAASNGWYAAGDSATVEASPSNGYEFAGWDGDVPSAGANDNPLILPMDRARAVAARFASSLVHYADAAGTNPVAPYASWATAATRIQDAVDAALAGDTVLVADGVYAAGGRAAYGAMTNRVCISKAITVRSVNGAGLTAIEGQGPVGSNAVRCAYVTNGAALVGFTLRNGATRATGDSYKERSGGGVWCAAGGVVSNCVIIGNAASLYGGGAAYATIWNSLIVSNTSAAYGGGAYSSTNYSCTVAGNTAMTRAGGTYAGSNVNSIVYGNSAATNANYYSGTFLYSCTLPKPLGSGNISNDPQFVSAPLGNWRPASGSPCVDAGTNQAWMAGAVDLDGNGRIQRGRVDLGAYELIPVPTLVAGPLALTNVVLQGANAAAQTFQVWNGGTGTVSYTVASNVPWLAAAPAGGTSTGELDTVTLGYSTAGLAAGTYGGAVTVTAPGAAGSPLTVSVTLVVRAPEVRYVDAAGTNPVAPYASWATAATRIQDAVDAALAGDTVLVADGVYAAGGRAAYGAMTNRVCISKAITVRSVNGAGLTAIEGQGPVGSNAVRCAYVTNGAALVGFTLRNGATRATGDSSRERSGGGVWCAAGGVVSNCVIIGNAASLYGGGAAYATIWNSLVVSNTSVTYGGGSYYGTLQGSLLTGNVSGTGGGTYAAANYSCTVAGNTATNRAGGTYSGSNVNSIVYGNSAVTNANYSSGTFLYSCTLPKPSGSGNISNDPQFVSAPLGNWRLASGSPCVDAGTNQAWMAGATDLDGNARVADGDTNGVATVDMGAYECAPAGAVQPALPAAGAETLEQAPAEGAGATLAAEGAAQQGAAAAEVRAYGDFSADFPAWHLVDGDTNTLWVGVPDGSPWAVTLDLGRTTDVTAIDVLFCGAPWTNMGLVGSADATTWFDCRAATNASMPLRYLHLNLWGGTNPPAIRELLWKVK